ncbi:MAG: hypothetical protein LBU27_06190 [Candidatus Peribacteria bacterium]|jgi:succinate dehydrogenase flavin-adding protein (antitoxin of CptAB toxin-antitoxin module)|nr:hypothetical protein [Candidatus Peribacteria bacterium]
MSGIIANESAGRQDDSHKTFLFNEITHMEKLKKLLEGMKDKKIASFSEKFAVQTTFNELPEAEKAEVQTQVDEVTARPETEPTAPATTTPTQGESVKEGGEGEGEGKEDPKPTESAEFKEIAKENKELKARLDRKDTEELFNERFAYSEKNKKGLFNSETQKEAFIKFHLTLNEEQKKQFKELIYGIDTKLQLAFKEVGSKEDVSSENMVEAIKKIQAEKSVDYAEATKIYRETYK